MTPPRSEEIAVSTVREGYGEKVKIQLDALNAKVDALEVHLQETNEEVQRGFRLKHLLQTLRAYWGHAPTQALTEPEVPLRAELFSTDQMERYGKTLAQLHSLSLRLRSSRCRCQAQALRPA